MWKLNRFLTQSERLGIPDHHGGAVNNKGGEYKMPGYADPNDERNSSKYHTGKSCIEGCGRPAGTAWGKHWCFECNVKRINRISRQLDSMCGAANKKGGE